MRHFPSDIAFTAAVKKIQEANGSREAYARMEQRHGWQTKVTEQLRDFLATRDMFYLGTANAEGQPYIQYRGGAPGFLKVLDETTLGFADLGGNAQYISYGNLTENPKAFIFLIDYEHSRRIKLWGTARMIEDDANLLEALRDPGYPGRPERAVIFTIEAWDINCPQHIHKRYLKSDVDSTIESLRARVVELEAKLTMAEAKNDTVD